MVQEVLLVQWLFVFHINTCIFEEPCSPYQIKAKRTMVFSLFACMEDSQTLIMRCTVLC